MKTVSSQKGKLYVALCILIPVISSFVILHKSSLRNRIANDTHTTTATLSRKQVDATYGKLPLAFEENAGQTDPQVRYLTHGNGYEVFLTPNEMVLSLRHATKTADLRANAPSRNSQEGSVLRVRFEGANPSSVTGVNKLPGRIDYFAGSDPKNWHTNVLSYSQVEYSNLYPGVDATFYGNHRRLEYDLTLAPGADPRGISLKIEGARQLDVDAHGNLSIHLANGEVSLEKPAVYQNTNEGRKELAGIYEITGSGEVSFRVPEFDRTKALVIDPVLDYSTYLGGSAVGDANYGVAVDASGNAYVAGTTFSTTFPTATGAYQTAGGATVATNGAAYVTELNAAGTVELYSSYLSGDNGEYGLGVAVDPVANVNCLSGINPGVCVYVTGQTFSQDFPNKNAYIAGPLAGDPVNGTAFVTKINPAATGSNSLVYSSFIGGTNGDSGNGVAVDAAGNAYVTGVTFSTGATGTPVTGDFFVRGGFQTTLGSADGNAFLIKINTLLTGDTSLVYSTFVGGSSTATIPADDGNGIAVDASNNAYVVGTTTSTDFPVTSANAFKSTAPTGITHGAAFVSKINTAATGSGSNVYSTYLSGTATSGDQGLAIALKPTPTSVAYVTGSTSSTFYVTTGAPVSSSMPSAQGLVFVSEVDTSKTGAASVTYSATVGGTGGDTAKGIAVDATGNIYVAGGAGSSDFPVTPGAIQPTRLSSVGNAFVLKLNPGSNGSADLLYSTYFGGSAGFTFARGLSVDSSNNAYIAGQTPAADFPVTAGSFQTSLIGSDAASIGSGFVSKLTLVPVLAFGSPCSIIQAPPASCSLTFAGQLIHTASTVQTFTLTNNTGSAIALTLPVTASGGNSTDFVASPAAAGGTGACAASLAAGASCAIGVTFTPSTGAAESTTLTVAYTYNNGVSATASGSQTVAVAGTGLPANPVAGVSPTTLTFGGQLVTTTSAAKTVTLTNSGGVALSLTAAPALSGTNASAFAISSGTTCTNGASVLPTASCIINVTFTPPAGSTATLSAVLSIADSASGSPQMVTLTGTPWDFTIAASPITVTHGSTGTIAVTVGSVDGFTGAVTLSCSATITQGSCAGPTSAVTAPGTGNITITTSSLIVPPSSVKEPPVALRQVALAILAMMLLFTLPIAQRFRTRLGLTGAAAVLIILAGCGGGSSTPTSTATPAGVYPVTVTGTSGAVSHAITVNVTVN